MSNISTQGILKRTAIEVEGLARLAIALDNSISEVCNIAALDLTKIQLQEIDLLRQSLQDVAAMLHNLAQGADPDAMTDALELASTIQLRGLAARVLNVTNEHAPPVTSGNITFF
jgi:hypothetical protein